MKMRVLLVTTLLAASASLYAQDAPPPRDGAPHDRMMFHHGPLDGPIMGFGKFWRDPEVQQKLNLSPDQQKKLDATFDQNRTRLMDLHLNLKRSEENLEPLISADQPDEAQVLAQIDQVAQARAELEKQLARMMLDMRKNLTPEQWKTLQSMHPPHGMMKYRQQRPGGAPPPQQ